MTVFGPLGAPTIDARQIRRTYTAALGNARTGPTAAEACVNLAGLLHGQIQLLAPALESELSDLAGPFTRGTARHVLAEAHAVLAVPVPGALPAETVCDLARLARSLLVLHESAV